MFVLCSPGLVNFCGVESVHRAERPTVMEWSLRGAAFEDLREGGWEEGRAG